MEYLFRTIKSESYHFICDEIKYLSTSKEVIQEMGEPLIVDKGQEWYFCYESDVLAGFISTFQDKILYAYTCPKYRNKGVFNTLYNELPAIKWQTIASNMSYPIFLKKGFKTIKNYKTCHKLKL